MARALAHSSRCGRAPRTVSGAVHRGARGGDAAVAGCGHARPTRMGWSWPSRTESSWVTGPTGVSAAAQGGGKGHRAPGPPARRSPRPALRSPPPRADQARVSLEPRLAELGADLERRLRSARPEHALDGSLADPATLGEDARRAAMVRAERRQLFSRNSARNPACTKCSSCASASVIPRARMIVNDMQSVMPHVWSSRSPYSDTAS